MVVAGTRVEFLRTCRQALTCLAADDVTNDLVPRIAREINIVVSGVTHYSIGRGPAEDNRWENRNLWTGGRTNVFRIERSALMEQLNEGFCSLWWLSHCLLGRRMLNECVVIGLTRRWLLDGAPFMILVLGPPFEMQSSRENALPHTFSGLSKRRHCRSRSRRRLRLPALSGSCVTFNIHLQILDLWSAIECQAVPLRRGVLCCTVANRSQSAYRL